MAPWQCHAIPLCILSCSTWIWFSFNYCRLYIPEYYTSDISLYYKRPQSTTRSLNFTLSWTHRDILTVHPDTADIWYLERDVVRRGGEFRVNSPGAASRPAAATPGTAPPLSPPQVCRCCRADRARTAPSNISAQCHSGKWRSLRGPRRIPDPSPSASRRRTAWALRGPVAEGGREGGREGGASALRCSSTDSHTQWTQTKISWFSLSTTPNRREALQNHTNSHCTHQAKYSEVTSAFRLNIYVISLFCNKDIH